MELRLEKQVENESKDSFEASVYSEPVPPNDIVSFNELRSCADLYRLYSTGKLELQPDFQREVVWKPEEQTRFVDSLVKQLPIPSMCFGLDYKTQKWKVIDGLQRMSSIVNFLNDDPWFLKYLEDIHPSLRGVSNTQLRDGDEEQQRLYSTVQDVSVPITVLRCDYAKNSHMQYLFTIFHRLNSGGVRLNNQEIRNCIYTGTFNSTLKNFDKKDKHWLLIKKRIWGGADRFRSVELLLRALAFSENLENYDGNLATFLNKYMHKNMDIDELQEEALLMRLSKMSILAIEALGFEETEKVSIMLIEALLVALLTNFDHVKNFEANETRACFVRMLENSSFSEASKYAIAAEKNVKARMKAAIGAFERA